MSSNRRHKIFCDCGNWGYGTRISHKDYGNVLYFDCPLCKEKMMLAFDSYGERKVIFSKALKDSITIENKLRKKIIDSMKTYAERIGQPMLDEHVTIKNYDFCNANGIFTKELSLNKKRKIGVDSSLVFHTFDIGRRVFYSTKRTGSKLSLLESIALNREQLKYAAFYNVKIIIDTETFFVTFNKKLSVVDISFYGIESECSPHGYIDSFYDLSKEYGVENPAFISSASVENLLFATLEDIYTKRMFLHCQENKEKRREIRQQLIDDGVNKTAACRIDIYGELKRCLINSADVENNFDNHVRTMMKRHRNTKLLIKHPKYRDKIKEIYENTIFKIDAEKFIEERRKEIRELEKDVKHREQIQKSQVKFRKTLKKSLEGISLSTTGGIFSAENVSQAFESIDF